MVTPERSSANSDRGSREGNGEATRPSSTLREADTDTVTGRRGAASESVLEQILTLSKDISFETRNNLLQTLATEGPLQAQLELQKAIFNKKREMFIKDKMEGFDFESSAYERCSNGKGVYKK